MGETKAIELCLSNIINDKIDVSVTNDGASNDMDLCLSEIKSLIFFEEDILTIFQGRAALGLWTIPLILLKSQLL